MNGSSNHTKNPLDRRSFMRSGLLAGGAATIGAGLLANGTRAHAQDQHGNGKLHSGDIAILRFLAAAELIEADLFEYPSDRKYDGIVIMGVIEHLPDYLRVLQKFVALLKPGGRIFLDGSACTKKYELSSFMVKYIYPGNHSFLVLDDFLHQLVKTPL